MDTSGQRCHGGDHSEEIGEGLSERDEPPPDFPECTHRGDRHDGCAVQFASKNDSYYHKTAEWRVSSMPPLHPMLLLLLLLLLLVVVT